LSTLLSGEKIAVLPLNSSRAQRQSNQFRDWVALVVSAFEVQTENSAIQICALPIKISLEKLGPSLNFQMSQEQDLLRDELTSLPPVGRGGPAETTSPGTSTGQ
jgi:hypothetical protein